MYKLILILLIVFCYIFFLKKNITEHACETGIKCCNPGYYGDSEASCTLCPSNKPSSPYGGRNDNCECPNSTIDKCVACDNPCVPYSSQSRKCLPYQCPSGQACKVVNKKATCVIPGCPPGKNREDISCCLPGFYGDDSGNCTECPSDKPSSSFSRPNANCQCPNSSIDKCFACKNLCRPYDSQSRMCLPYKCPSGQTCKVQSGKATCV